jgi:NADH-quinone oxidoreductase subunit F
MDYTIDVAGTTTVQALLEAASADAADIKAVWLSYPTASFVKADRFGEELEVAEGTTCLRAYGPEDCMCDALRVVVDELRMATECTCTFGHEGGYQLSVILNNACTKKGQPADLALIRDLAPVMEKQAICGEGQAIGRVCLQALELFADEIEPHFAKKSCPTFGCVAFKTYHVLVSRCTGCGACLKACEDDAIMGKPKFVHVINQRSCTQCGLCLPACPEKAIVRAGAKKPKTPPKPIPVRKK